MADLKQSQEPSQEFLGGGPKFNTVGKDTRVADEPPVAVNPASYVRIAVVAVVLILLAGGLIYLNDRRPGQTTAPYRQGGQGVAPSDKAAPSTDPNFK